MIGIGGIAYITGEPAIPQLRAKLRDMPAVVSVEWRGRDQLRNFALAGRRGAECEVSLKIPLVVQVGERFRSGADYTGRNLLLPAIMR